MNFRLKISKLDIFVIVFLAIASLILSFSVYILPKDGDCATVYVMGKNELSLDLNSTKDVTVTLYEGNYSKIIKDFEDNDSINYIGYFPSIENQMDIEIKDEKIRVTYTECPAKVCINQGWVSIPNVPITCTHNRVMVVIESNNSDDIDIIL